MPYIQTKTNVTITPQKEAVLKAKLGEAIAAIPGKSESWLMCEFADQCRLWFQGDNSNPIAYVEVKIFGKADPASYEKLTGLICGILEEELEIAKNRIYVKYEEIDHWGWNGTNF
jgi:hypothetical protein